MTKRTIGCLTGIIAGLAACAGQIPRPEARHVTWAQKQWPGVTAARLQEGRTVFINKCSGCHALVPPQSYPKNEWPVTFEDMSREAKLTDSQKEVAWQYIRSMIEEN